MRPGRKAFLGEGEGWGREGVLGKGEGRKKGFKIVSKRVATFQDGLQDGSRGA